ncbi:hypothetical protein BBK36DRAFT_1162649 [Trichoderma citrinoviride]|uniref:Uncharacterized protein n=1 Tax=Trichoderma citrinoviride TaxID=58853 RepID=A0A2T4B0L9_9HYPO|nr:hypothetical protein BBK36DRAFT_1162649 [Trichoderma citrinoviride]PTB62865.1 hypothetical protein BBK36DRAFT_1162649 [Trichoderma citrinoviride]
MDTHAQQNPLFRALDIILAYLNHGNSLPEIKVLASDAEAWCQHHHHLLLPALPFDNDNNNNYSSPATTDLDDVLRAHPNLFDLSIRSSARLYAFDGISPSSSSSSPTQTPSPTQRTTATLVLSPCPVNPHAHAPNDAHTYTSPSPLLITAQHFFSAILDAYTLSVGGGGSEKSKRPSSSSHDDDDDDHHHVVVAVVVAQDLKASPIIYYMPEVVRRIAALDARDLLTTQFSTFSPKTSLGFSCYLGKNKGFDVVMMDAPPPPVVCPGEGDSRVEFMDVDDDAGPAAADANRQRLRQTPKLQS